MNSLNERSYNILESSSFPASMLGHQTTTNNGAPRAYLNWLVFDRNYVFITGGFKQITTAAKEAGTDIAHEKLQMPAPITITQPGYVYIYLSNENTTQVEVFFDEFKVTHTKSPVIQMDDYYPFGLTFNSFRRENNVPNQFLFNGGSELQGDLGSGWYHTLFRTYDPAIGRFMQVDLLADFFPGISPYNFALDNPITFGDPDGLGPLNWLRRLINGFSGDGASRQARQAQRRANAHGTTRSRGGPRGHVSTTSTEPEPPPKRNYGPDRTLGKDGWPCVCLEVEGEPENNIKVPVYEHPKRRDPDPPIVRAPDPPQYPKPNFNGTIIPNGGLTFNAYSFEARQTTLFQTPENEKLIHDLVRTLKEFPSLHLMIQGNWNGPMLEDDPGFWKRDWGKVYGEEIRSIMSGRAKAIYDALRAAGIPASQISHTRGTANPGMENQSATFKITKD